MAAEHPYVGVFDLFKIGIGPSSSHSVGPMRAAEMFLAELEGKGRTDAVGRVEVDLYGSLALTGIGHATDIAVLMGLQGEVPDQIDPASVAAKLAMIRQQNELRLAGKRTISFLEKEDLRFHRKTFLEGHPNALRFRVFATREASEPLAEATYYSIGGGFVIQEGCEGQAIQHPISAVPFPFNSAAELLKLAEQNGCGISQIAWENERAFRTEAEIRDGLQKIWETMQACVERGCRNEGILPGGLNVRRRAPSLFQTLTGRPEANMRDPLNILDWVDLYAIAVNEENAAGGRVVTAPTNGAAGIIPAVLCYFDRFCPESTPEKIQQFLLTAAAIGALYKKNASISGAEVGCQGEVGVACSMAAGALTEVRGGNPHQVEEAAEIGMEHNLGLTCDPIKGLVQVPCIERNAMGAVKAINACRLALRGDGSHFVSLDRVIRVMKRTGADMSSRYKETSRGGLAVNISEC
ncbi:L-serine ammonia-lyase [Blastopirellula marina]|uniref:L-serine dehydratase n=1 Tax=Blastopirellula marina TaxID=124 RepID=A0A2S8G2I2_9BACT|nr:L-serine ammonia-lyase [Blastopirellula marina]PTL45316.1 L-serine ammonia-lyase [Blastopirellula marina]